MRHGNTFGAGEVPFQVGERTDLPLTVEGHKQAEAMVKRLTLEGICPKAVYAGALKRQRESAIIVAQSFGLPVFHEDSLTEIDYGAWEGLTVEQIGSRWPKEYTEWADGKWQGTIFGSTLEGRLSAIGAWMESLQRRGDATVLAVTSTGPLRLFRNEKVQTGHFCEIHLGEKGLKIERWNVDPQLQNRFSKLPFP